jgi:hypothetical protein
VSIPNFLSAETAWLTEPPTEPDQCEDYDCGRCAECLAADAEDQAEKYGAYVAPAGFTTSPAI